MTTWRCACLLVLVASLPRPSAAGEGHLVIEGLLRTADGTPVDGGGQPYSMDFSLYAAKGDINALWHELVSGVQVDNGYFQARLGNETPLDATLFAQNPALWVGAKIVGQPEFERLPLETDPYAFRARSAAVADSVACSGCIEGVHVKGGSLPLAKLSGIGCNGGEVVAWSQTLGAFVCAKDALGVYSNGTGLLLAGSTFSADEALIKSWATDVAFDTQAEVLALLVGYDDNEADDLTLGTLFNGHVQGSWDSLVLAIGSVTSDAISDAVQFLSLRDGSDVERLSITEGQRALQVVGAGSVGVAFDAVARRMTITGTDTTSSAATGGGLTMTGTDISIADGGVTSARLADLAVTTQHIADGAVTNAKIDDGVTYVSVRNGAGEEQLTVTDGARDLGFTGGGATTVTFDAASRRVVVSSQDTAYSAAAGGGLALNDTAFSIANGGVSTLRIADGAVTAAKLGESCTDGQVLKRSGGKWVCANDENTVIACNWSGTAWVSHGWDGGCAFAAGARLTCTSGRVVKIEFTTACGCGGAGYCMQ